MPSRRNVSFSTSRSCATSSDRAPGRTGTDGGEEADRVGGHALPLVGHDRRVERDHLGERGLVAERPDHEVAHGAAQGASADRVQEAEAEAERDAGQREHAPELAAAEHRDQLTRRVGVDHPDLSSAPIG